VNRTEGLGPKPAGSIT